MKRLLCALFGLFIALPVFATCTDYVSATGTVTQTGTPTPEHPITPTFYTQGNMVLRAAGNVADSYDATTGKITRRIGVKVLDGTEDWVNSSVVYYGIAKTKLNTNIAANSTAVICTHYAASATSGVQNTIWVGTNNVNWLVNETFSTIQEWKNFLAAQYAAGTPVIIYYPLATPVEEDWSETQYGDTCNGCHPYTSATGTVSWSGDPTPTNPATLTFYQQGEITLRKVSIWKDSYDSTTGILTQNIGVIELDGTEEFVLGNPLSSMFNLRGTKALIYTNDRSVYSTHFKTQTTLPSARNGYIERSSDGYIGIGYEAAGSDVGAFKSWLAQQKANGTPVRIYYPLPQAITQNVGTEWCNTKIKIATTKYNNTAFGPVVTALNNAVDTIKTVVSNTINQATAVANLQSGKQTMPNSTTTNGTCPNYKQCLLVEDESGTPHWYVITDPFRDLFSPVIANNIAATSTTSQNAYTQLQYIYMMEGSYIKVEDLPISAGYRVEFDFQTTTLSSPLRNYIGGRVNGVSAGGGFRLSKLASSNNNRVVLYGFESGTEYYDPTTQFQANTRYKYTYNNGVCTLETGGSVVSTRTFTVTDTTSTKWGINAYVSGDDYWQTDSEGIYVYSLKVWNPQGELVMNLVPAIQGTAIGFFDTATGDLRGPSAGTFTAGSTVSNQNAAWTATFGGNDTYGYGRSIVYGTATCNATSGSANDVATSTQMSANNWTATGSNCWCYAERVNETNSGVSGTSANRWVYLTVPSGETCAANCVENCANAVASGAVADKPFRQALTGL